MLPWWSVLGLGMIHKWCEVDSGGRCFLETCWFCNSFGLETLLRWKQLALLRRKHLARMEDKTDAFPECALFESPCQWVLQKWCWKSWQKWDGLYIHFLMKIQKCFKTQHFPLESDWQTCKSLRVANPAKTFCKDVYVFVVFRLHFTRPWVQAFQLNKPRQITLRRKEKISKECHNVFEECPCESESMILASSVCF